MKKAPKVSELKNKTIKEKKSVMPCILVCSGYCIDRLQPFQCLIFVAVCLSIASFSTSVLHYSQSLHVVNVISQCFNKLNSLCWDLKPFFALKVMLLLLFGKCFMLRSCYCLSQPKLFQQWRILNATMAQWTDRISCQRDCCPSSRSPTRGWKQWTRTRRKDW